VSVETLRARGEQLCDALGWPRTCVRESTATVGGGSLPGSQLASVALVAPTSSAEGAAEMLRQGEPPLLGRVHGGELWIDLRTLVDTDDAALLTLLRRVVTP
jgi:L-seryl-tRNA(Ser) seleniumtransferase